MSISAKLNVDKQEGFVGITVFKFTPIINPLKELKSVLWQFGDGATSTKINPTHTYFSPGTFNISLKCFGKDGSIIELETTIFVDLLINESIKFEYVPPPTFSGHYNRHPFKIQITSSNTQEHTVHLAAVFSRSEESKFDNNKWAFLKPQWKFLNLKGQIIDSIVTTDSIIKCNDEGILTPTGTHVVGTSGYAEFYFIEDLYNTDLAVSREAHTCIVATLETANAKDFNLQTESSTFLSNFSNSRASIAIPYLTVWRSPDYLKISENGLRAYANPRWSTGKNPIVVSASISSRYVDNWIDGNGVAVPNIDSFFLHNFPLLNTLNFDIAVETGQFVESVYYTLSTTETISISTTETEVLSTTITETIELSALYQKFVPIDCTFDSPPRFEWSDYSLHKRPGYYKGMFDIADVNKTDVYIRSIANIPIPSLSSNLINPLLWLSNPEAGLVAVAQYNTLKEQLTSVIPQKTVAHVYNFDMPVKSTGLSGFHGIYSIAATPAPHFHAWMLDSELQYLYRTTTKGQILCAIDLNALVVANGLSPRIPGVVTPATMVLDKFQNIWITLYDSPSTIKLDSFGNFLTAVVPPSSVAIGLPYNANISIQNQTLSWYDQISYFDRTINLFDDVNLIEPTGIDTDMDNNVYITYSHPISSFVVKYDSDGTVLDANNTFDVGSTPQEIVCDNFGDFWVSLAGDDGDYLGYIEKRNHNMSPLEDARFGPFKGLNNLTIDADQDLWFTYDYRSVGKITVTTDLLGHDNYQLDTIEVVNDSSLEPNDDFTALEGISYSLYGKIYVINSIENQVYVIDKDTLAIESSFFINPQGFVSYIDKNNHQETAYSVYNKSLQAQGDWTGFRWTNKYGNTLSTGTTQPFVLSVSGISNSLNFYTDNTPAFNVAKLNETFNMADYLKSLSYVPRLQDSSVLYDKFFASIFGDGSSSHQDLGVAIYEKIANFSMNHVDVDTCNLDQLYSLSEMVDLDTDDFRMKYPPAIKRLIDLTSINLSRLRGVKDACMLEFHERDYGIGGFYNRGALINPDRYIVYPDVPVVLKTKNTNSYRLIYPGPILLPKFSINILANFLRLKQPWNLYYEFYEYIPGPEGKQLEGVIDWDNEVTTLSYDLSSVQRWYDNGGPIDVMFSYELYNGLNLLNK